MTAKHTDSMQPINVSRRKFMGFTVKAFALATVVPAVGGVLSKNAEAAAAATNKVTVFIEIQPDNTVYFKSPFVEGGQGVATAMAQIVGEELDMDPAAFVVECGPAGHKEYEFVMGMRITGGSMSVRMSYPSMRALGASARAMLLQAAAEKWQCAVGELTTDNGRVIHKASSRVLNYGDIVEQAMVLPVPADVPLKDPANFKWIGKPVKRLDARDKSTGAAKYAIDLRVDGMVFGAVQHSPRLGMNPVKVANQAEIEAMPGVHSVNVLPGAVGVLASSWWRAKRAVDQLSVQWAEAEKSANSDMPVDYSSSQYREFLAEFDGEALAAEEVGDVKRVLAEAESVLEATYTAPHLAHAQLEVPSALVQFHADGTLEMWLPNQAPDMFRGIAAQVAGLDPAKVIVHSPPLGGFFGRHFPYNASAPMINAILLAKASGKPVKLLWSREEEFLRDAYRPTGVARFKGAVGDDRLPLAIHAQAVGEGAMGRVFGKAPDKPDSTAVEGIAGKHYAVPNRLVEHVFHTDSASLGFWRSVGHSMNDFFYECFFDELADAGHQDPYELRLQLLADKPRQLHLLKTVGELAGGWKRGPYRAADGSKRARGVAMASPFGSEVATIAEVSVADEVVVHNVWVAIDPGSIVNPAIIEAQVQSAVALGLSSTLVEEMQFEEGMPHARNFDKYRVLRGDKMPTVHVAIVESGAPMGGIGEPGLPGVAPAVVNAVSTLLGKRIRSLPLSKSLLS